MMFALPVSIPGLLSMLVRMTWASLFTRQPSQAEALEAIRRATETIRALRLRAEVAERGCVCLRRELEAEREAALGGRS